MEESEALIIHKIFLRTSKVVPTEWDMHHIYFNCGCHLEPTQKTYELISNEFNISLESAQEKFNEFSNII